MRLNILVGLACAVLVMAGCVKEPEGPAEQIGKGIDQIASGLDRYEKDTAGQRGAYERDRDAYARRRAEEERRRRESESTYKRDPYWDDDYTADRDYGERRY